MSSSCSSSSKTKQLILKGNAYDNFVNTIKSEATLEGYNRAIERFMQYLNITDVNNLLTFSSSQDPLLIQKKIIEYISYLKNKNVSAITMRQYIAAIMYFYAMNDITLNRKKIGRYIPNYVRKQKDRAYTIQEISQLLEFCDHRNKAIVLLFASTDMRIGAIPDLRLEHLHKIEKYNLYQITVYYGTKEEYICFLVFWIANNK
jgi:site-specific recombinase XerD